MKNSLTTVEPALPIYRQIEDVLRTRIKSGELAPGARFPTINDLRHDFGVNHLTVRQALKGLIEDGLIRAEQGRGTFVQQRMRFVGRVALVLPHLEDALFLNIARGVQRVLNQADTKTLILDSRNNGGEEIEALAHLEELSLDGAIIFPVIGSDIAERVCHFKKQGFPIVLIDRTLQDIETPSVVVDNYGGGYATAEHLVARGRRRILWMGESSTSNAAQARLSGLRDGLADADIALPRTRQCDLILQNVLDGPSYRRALRDAVGVVLDECLAQTPLPDAIACGNDLTALCVLEKLAAHGITVPDQVAVIGFDDIPDALIGVSLSTVRQPMEGLGEEAARLMLERIRKSHLPIRQIVLPVEIIERDTT